MIVSSDPPDGAIDARRPHLPNDASTTFGWNSIGLTMSGSASGITAGNFSVESTPNTNQPSVTSIAISGNVVTVNLSSRIPPDAWTEITYNPGQSSICLGYLPADANQTLASTGADITALVDQLNGVYSPAMQIWQCDIDRSAACAPADIIDMVDLLNGANAYDVWNGATIATSPCEGESLMDLGEEEDHFAVSFLTYLTGTELADSAAEAEFEVVIWALTEWCVANCDVAAKNEIVTALEDDAIAFQNDVALKLVPGIMETLTDLGRACSHQGSRVSDPKKGPDGTNPAGPTFGCCRMQLRWLFTAAHLYD